MHHYTITTGDTRWSPRDEVDRAILGLCQDAVLPAILAGDRAPVPRCPPYYLTGARQIGALATTCWADRGAQRVPLAIWWVAADAESAEMWDYVVVPHVQRTAHTVGYQGKPKRPDSTPWVAAWLEIGSVLHLDAAVWLGDLERCLAWAWIDYVRQERGHQRST